MNLHHVLTNYGLSSDETAVYLACLQLGPSRVQDVAKRSGVKRTTVYLVAKSLMQRGLMGQYTTKKGLHLIPQSPDTFVKQLEERLGGIKEILPELHALSHTDAVRPRVTYYEGKQGYYDVCEDTLLMQGEELLWLGYPSDIYRTIGETYDKTYYIPTRLKKGISVRALLVRNAWSEKAFREENKKLLRKIRFLPPEFTPRSTQLIYQNKIAFVTSTVELMSVVVESTDIADMERGKFEFLWKHSEER